MLQILNTQPTILENIGNFLNDFFNPQLEGYTNFEFSEGAPSLKIIIFGLFIGVLIASFSMIFIKTTLGRLVRALLAKNALDGEQAVTLADCGLEKHIFIRMALKHGYTLRRVVRCVEEEQFLADVRREAKEYEEKRHEAKEKGKRLPAYREPRFQKKLEECHFYIPEKDKYIAEMRFRARGSGYLTFLFVLLGSVACIFLIFAFLPQLLIFFDNVVSIFSWKGNLAR